MHTFLWSGKDPEGVPRSERVRADDAQAARAVLESRGWSDLQLLTDEIADFARQQMPPLPEEWDAAVVNDPDAEAARLRGEAPSFLQEWGKAIFEAKGTIAMCALILAFGKFTHSTGMLVVGVASLTLIVLLFPVVRIFLSQSGRNYSRLNQAKTWGRWDEVLHCVELLKRSHRLTRIGVGEFELARNRALALAHKGQLEPALKEFSVFETRPGVPRWTYLSFLAGIYDAGEEHEKALEFRQQAANENPSSSVVWIDLAYGSVRWLNRPAEATAALARAETLEITGLGKPYVLFVRGIIYWREHRYREAKEQLTLALQDFEKLAHLPLVEGLILISQAYLCAVCRGLGEASVAKEFAAKVEKFLRAHRETELLHACGFSASTPANAKCPTV